MGYEANMLKWLQSSVRLTICHYLRGNYDMIKVTLLTLVCNISLEWGVGRGLL